jgi:hypothetical protein
MVILSGMTISGPDAIAAVTCGMGQAARAAPCSWQRIFLDLPVQFEKWIGRMTGGIGGVERMKIDLQLRLGYTSTTIAENPSIIPRINEEIYYCGKHYLIEEIRHEYSDGTHTIVLYPFK